MGAAVKSARGPCRAPSGAGALSVGASGCRGEEGVNGANPGIGVAGRVSRNGMPVYLKLPSGRIFGSAMQQRMSAFD